MSGLVFWACLDLFWGVWTCILGVWTCVLGVWTCVAGVWTCVAGVWTSILGVWTCILGVWTCILGVCRILGVRVGRQTDGRTGPDGRTNGWTDRMDGRKDGWRDRRTDGQMDERTHGRKDGCTGLDGRMELEMMGGDGWPVEENPAYENPHGATHGAICLWCISCGGISDSELPWERPSIGNFQLGIHHG